MNKNEKQQYTEDELIQIPESVAAKMYADIHDLMVMHRTLITLYEREAELKKRHRAYLHIRDLIDKVCHLDKMRLEELHSFYDVEDEEEESEDESDDVFGVLILPCGETPCEGRTLFGSEAEMKKKAEEYTERIRHMSNEEKLQLIDETIAAVQALMYKD